MKRFLPKSAKNPKGFTLIELMVVVSIIAILSIIGVVVYTGVQKNARDSRRKGDIDAIAKALEVNKTATGYVVLAATQFGNAIPTLDPQNYPYCGNSTASSQPATPAVWTTTCPANYGPISVTIPPAGTSWKICTSLETGGAGGAASVYCVTSAQ